MYPSFVTIPQPVPQAPLAPGVSMVVYKQQPLPMQPAIPTVTQQQPPTPPLGYMPLVYQQNMPQTLPAQSYCNQVKLESPISPVSLFTLTYFKLILSHLYLPKSFVIFVQVWNQV